MKISKNRNLLQLLLVLLFSVSSLAIPMPERINLPIPANLTDEDRDLIYEALKLQVYQDSENNDHYYYMPPLHFKQYGYGAASMTLAESNLKHYAEAMKHLNDLNVYREQYNPTRLEELQTEVEKAKANLAIARKELQSAIMTNNQEIIALYKEFFNEESSNLAQVKAKLEQAQEASNNGHYLLPGAVTRGYFDRIIFNISFMGARLGHSSGEDIEVVEDAIYGKLNELGGSYGGFLSANIYGGFTKAQKDAIIAYRTKFFPTMRISLLPIENLSFVPLTEWQKDPNDTQAKVSRMFTSITGAGDYLGAAITLNTTINASSGLAKRLGPFIPPLGVKATLKEQLSPVEAELNCDFTQGFEIKGHHDISSGGININEHDISKIVDSGDASENACALKILKGDINSGYFAALKELEMRFEELGMTRINVGREEKEEYIRRYGSPYQTYGVIRPEFIPMLAESMKNSPNFQWRATAQTIKHLATLKFSHKISINGYEKVEKFLPVDLCLIYNEAFNAYDRCQDMEEANAVRMTKSIMEASSSTVCQGTVDPLKCGELRGEAKETAYRQIVSYPKDDDLPTNM